MEENNTPSEVEFDDNKQNENQRDVDENQNREQDEKLEIVENNTEPTEKPSEPTVPFVKKSKKTKKMFWVVIILALLIIGGAAAWYFLIYNQPSGTVANNSQQNTDTNKPDVIEEIDPQMIKFITPTTGEKWLETPEKIAKQGFFITQDPSWDSGEKATTYYRVGSRGKVTIILSESPSMQGYEYNLFEKTADGNVTLINHPDGNAVYNSDYDEYLKDAFTSKVQISNSIHYDSVSIPDELKISDGDVLKSPGYPSIGYEMYSKPDSTETNALKDVLIRQLGESKLYKFESTAVDTNLTSIGYFLVTPFNTRIKLDYEPLDLSISNYKWNSGSTVGKEIKAITRGCGNLFASVTRSNDLTMDDLQTVGKSGGGKTIYSIKDKNDVLQKKAYDEFHEFWKSDTESWLADVTYDQFISYHGVVVFKNLQDEWLVYVNSELAPAGGCAKPVIYLYPETTMAVSVKVGADVKISNPYYNPRNGWNVVAKPNGQLMLDGKNYDSLFWEGPGYGEYPQITKGTVVKQSNLISTIRRQLAEQGLNKIETNDFVEYWADKLPTKPYVRLTWFNTAQMNQLAPLYISPKPNTVVRVFLDASGLDKPISIPKQTLKSIPRNGFTVVEWGGLSNRKLY